MILILHINDSKPVFQRCRASALYSLDYVSGIYIQYGDYISTPHWIYRSTGKRKETESIESTPPPYLKSLSGGDIVLRFWLLSSSIKEFVNNTKTTETRL